MSAVDARALHQLIQQLFEKHGASDKVASTVARVLLEGDLLGHHTHGVKLAQGYLKDIRAGHARVDPAALETTRQTPVAAQYDANYLLGPYCVEHALAFAADAAKTFGIGIANIRRSHHIACLAAYLQPVTKRGLMPIIYTSDPAVASVAPFGGLDPVYTPNPLAIGIPTSQQPILIDVSMSNITNGLVNKTRAAGEQLEHATLLDNKGQLSRDPEAFFTDPPGSILPLGGLEFGHKGFALGTMVEALTAGLGGFGRRDQPEGWGAAVCVMVLDPEHFGGLQAFEGEMDHFVSRCRSSRERIPGQPVRLPGHAGLARRERYLAEGIPLPDDVLMAVRGAAAEGGIDCPF
jgi:LDH2 family malate/lactate/ureidoglycolate dehydrogenase